VPIWTLLKKGPEQLEVVCLSDLVGVWGLEEEEQAIVSSLLIRNSHFGYCLSWVCCRQKK
jgi:hypothetical protein